jgi:hypothetical protein
METAREPSFSPSGRRWRGRSPCRMRGYAPSIDRAPSSGPNFATLIRATFSREGRRKRKSYTDAVVTPPSTTMVCPVMKLEASEPR